MLRLTFSSKLDWGSYIISIAKLPPRKLEPWFVLWRFFLFRLLCISINLPYHHVWSTVIMSGLVLLIATWNCWTSYKATLAASLEALAHRWIVASLSLFYRYYFDRCSSELAQQVLLPGSLSFDLWSKWLVV